MKGEDFLVVAKAMLQLRTEAASRSAISRAYYALFNSASHLLRELGVVIVQSPSGHGEVKNYLFNCGITPAVDFARTLDELRTKRNLADYNMETAIFLNQNDCAWLVAKAEIAVRAIATFQQEPLRQQIQNGIRAYERKIKYA